jgi:hypothetical protein
MLTIKARVQGMTDSQTHDEPPLTVLLGPEDALRSSLETVIAPATVPLRFVCSKWHAARLPQNSGVRASDQPPTQETQTASPFQNLSEIAKAMMSIGNQKTARGKGVTSAD